MTVSLEKWLYNSPDRKSVYVDLDSMRQFYSMGSLVPDLEKLSNYIKEKQGKNVNPVFYLSHNSPALSVRKEEGFIMKTGLQIEDRLKCSEMNLAVDLMCDAYGGNFDKAILISGNIEKYRTLLNHVRAVGKSVKEVSLKKMLLEGDGVEQFIKNTSKSDQDLTMRRVLRGDAFDYRLMSSGKSDLRSKMRGTKKSNKKTILYVDHGNVFHRIKKLNDNGLLMPNIDTKNAFSRLKQRAESRNELIEANMFLGFPEISNDMPVELGKQILQLKHSMNDIGYEIHMSLNQNQYGGGMKEVSVDLEMGVNAIISTLRKRCQKVILVTGDADFVPVVKKLRELKQEFEVWCYRNALSGELFKHIGNQDRLQFLDNFLFQ